MRIGDLCRFAVSIGGAVVMLTGCGALSLDSTSTSSASLSAGSAQRDMSTIDAPGTLSKTIAVARHLDRGRSWMLPEAMTEDLLYVADYGGGVIIYAYRPAKLKYVGYLAAPLYAEGECVDKQQDVFITASNYEIYEYAHGATTPKAILTDPFATPLNCAADPTTGDLAAVGYTIQGQSDGVAIFKNARGKPKLYPDSGFGWACAYDDQGNLFMDGGGPRNGYIKFAELPKGSTTFTNIQLNQTFNAAGGVQWDGHYIAVGDYYNAVVYQFSISGSTGTEVGFTPLAGSGTVWSFFIDRVRGHVIAPSYFGFQPGFVKIYNYPGGGAARRTINFGSPFGVVISLGSR